MYLLPPINLLNVTHKERVLQPKMQQKPYKRNKKNQTINEYRDQPTQPRPNDASNHKHIFFRIHPPHGIHASCGNGYQYHSHDYPTDLQSSPKPKSSTNAQSTQHPSLLSTSKTANPPHITSTSTNNKQPDPKEVLNSFSYINIQGLKPKTVQSKVSYISDILHTKKQLFIGLTETWLHNHTDAELHISGYKIFRTDSTRRKTSQHGRYSGGVAMYVRNDLAATFKPVLNYSDNAIQIIVIYSEHENLALATIYHQPDDHQNNRSTSENYSQAINELHQVLNISPSPDIFIMGDFNLPHTNWPDCTPNQNSSRGEKEMITITNNLLLELSLTQIIRKPTHIAGNILDLVFTNNTNIIHDISFIHTLRSISHHCFLDISTSYVPSHIPQQTIPRVFSSPFDLLNYQSENVNWT